jgi:hypothetical protein
MSWFGEPVCDYCADEHRCEVKEMAKGKTYQSRPNLPLLHLPSEYKARTGAML